MGLIFFFILSSGVVNLKAVTHQADVKELAVTKAVSSSRLLLSQKAALEHTANITADCQLACALSIPAGSLYSSFIKKGNWHKSVNKAALATILNFSHVELYSFTFFLQPAHVVMKTFMHQNAQVRWLKVSTAFCLYHLDIFVRFRHFHVYSRALTRSLNWTANQGCVSRKHC